MDNRYEIKNKHLAVSKQWVKDQILKNELYMIESSFETLKDGFFAFTKEGYIVKVTANSIYKNQSNPIFSNLNPYTIYNIKRYLYLNNIDTILLSELYVNNHTNLEWICSCGNHFYVPWNRFLQGQIVCKTCARRNYFAIPIDKIKNDFRSRGYIVHEYRDRVKRDFVEYGCIKHRDKGIQRISLTKFYDRQQGCKYCSIDNNAEKHRVSEDECKELCRNVGLKYMKSYIKNQHTHIDFICSDHEHKGIQTFSITRLRQSKYGCKYCNMVKYKNEEIINDVLLSWNLKFERQQCFDDCRDKNAMPFDFYIPCYNLLIEYQGEHHYQVIRRGSMTQEEALENFRLIQYHDQIKRDYCLSNNINYIEIPYWENQDLPNYLFDKFIEYGFIKETKSA